jgi:folate-binding protein YgfZ
MMKKTLSPVSLLNLTGSDAFEFLQGQITQNMKLLDSEFSIEACLLNNAGQIIAPASLKKSPEGFFLLCSADLKQTLITRIQKYLISEDVEINDLGDFTPVWGLASTAGERLLEFFFYGELIGIDLKNPKIVGENSQNSFLSTIASNGFEWISVEKSAKYFINETRFIPWGQSFTKGCYLGQETVNKIHNNRGAANYPVILELSESFNGAEEIYSSEKRIGRVLASLDKKVIVSLLRDFRIDGFDLTFIANGKEFHGRVKIFALDRETMLNEIFDNLYHDAVNEYSINNNADLSKKMLESLIGKFPKKGDAYESLGVILGHEGNFLAAIDLMDSLLELDPENVMSHTNKSLFYMKMGNIEKAEDEKAKATMKTFMQAGKKSLDKKNQEAKAAKEKAERDQKKLMFNEVMEIDPDDEIALLGLGEIYYHEQNYSQATELLEKLLTINPKQSQAYLWLGLVHQHTGNKEQAKNIWSEGVKIAAAKGDLMPANQMQGYLRELR